MKKLIILLIFSILTSLIFFPKRSYAYDPLSVPNNKIGIHILFVSELEKAAKLINSNGGDWGYVVIPIQTGDRDLLKWQKFMDECKRLHIIPILRLATAGDYFNTSVWSKPTTYDVLDFANFLNSLNFPTKNRYIIAFNEVNRADEWQGAVSASEYAEILDYTVDIFKERNPDFFIISAGMDNAAANSQTSVNQYDFLRQMQISKPGIFSKIDGFASHSYPNPAFSSLPNSQSPMGIRSFEYEKELIDSYAGKNLPVFITETGWTSKNIPNTTIALYFKDALENAWNNPQIVTIAPFLLQASGEPFSQFSFLDGDTKTPKYITFEETKKVKGEPIIPQSVIATTIKQGPTPQPKDFDAKNIVNVSLVDSYEAASVFGKWFLGF